MGEITLPKYVIILEESGSIYNLFDERGFDNRDFAQDLKEYVNHGSIKMEEVGSSVEFKTKERSSSVEEIEPFIMDIIEELEYPEEEANALVLITPPKEIERKDETKSVVKYYRGRAQWYNIEKPADVKIKIFKSS